MELKLVQPAESDAFDDAFFQQSSIAPVEMELSEEDLEELHEEPVAAASRRRSMHVALGMLGVSLAAVGGFLLYAKVIMPTPVELGAAGAVAPMLQPMAADEPALPQAQSAAPVAPASAEDAPTVAAAIPAPVPAFEVGDPGPVAAAQAARSTSAPRGPDALVKQAFRSLNHGDARQAITSARRALATEPSRADAWLVLGSAYDALHDRPSAQLAFRTCAQRAQGPHARTCEQLIRN